MSCRDELENTIAQGLPRMPHSQTAMGPYQKPNILLTREEAGLDYYLGGLDKNERPMLPPFIIEQIRKREEEERRSRHQDQPRLEIPLDVHRPASPREQDEDTELPDRGVVILDVLGNS
jgi:hypothetical protein